MASSYPGALDAFSNPSASDTLDSATVPHHTQHSDANDAIEAIQATLGVNPQGSSATVTQRLSSISAGSSVIISGTTPTDLSVLWADTNDNPIGYTYNVVAKTANYTVLSTDEIVTCNTSGGAFSVTLPAASTCKGRRFFFKKIDTSSNKLTIVGNIETDINPTLGPGVDDVTIFSDGFNFYYWGF